MQSDPSVARRALQFRTEVRSGRVVFCLAHRVTVRLVTYTDFCAGPGPREPLITRRVVWGDGRGIQAATGGASWVAVAGSAGRRHFRTPYGQRLWTGDVFNVYSKSCSAEEVPVRLEL